MKAFVVFALKTSPCLAASMALRVSAFGTRTSKGIAFSDATRISNTRIASESDKPMSAKTRLASLFTFSSTRALTTQDVVIWRYGYGYNVATTSASSRNFTAFYTAEESLYRSSRTYHLATSLVLPTATIEPALVGCFRRCAQFCAPDDELCLECCMCVCSGRHPNQCCF